MVIHMHELPENKNRRIDSSLIGLSHGKAACTHFRDADRFNGRFEYPRGGISFGKKGPAQPRVMIN
jgi:hypothetical protein